jgi:hypothetical protein
MHTKYLMVNFKTRGPVKFHSDTKGRDLGIDGNIILK